MYALPGDRDLCLIADYPSIEGAVRASVGLTRLTGISFSTSQAIAMSEFDRLARQALGEG